MPIKIPSHLPTRSPGSLVARVISGEQRRTPDIRVLFGIYHRIPVSVWIGRIPSPNRIRQVVSKSDTNCLILTCKTLTKCCFISFRGAPPLFVTSLSRLSPLTYSHQLFVVISHKYFLEPVGSSKKMPRGATKRGQRGSPQNMRTKDAHSFYDNNGWLPIVLSSGPPVVCCCQS